MYDVSTLYVNRETFHFAVIPNKINMQDEGLACDLHLADLTISVKSLKPCKMKVTKSALQTVFGQRKSTLSHTNLHMTFVLQDLLVSRTSSSLLNEGHTCYPRDQTCLYITRSPLYFFTVNVKRGYIVHRCSENLALRFARP
jgi:hypothetical protein